MQWLAQPNGKRGRNQTFSDAAIQFCLSIKCLFGQPLRQSLGMLQSLLTLADLDWPVPDFSTVCRRQKRLQVQLSYRPSNAPPHLLVDSTGIKFLGEGEWKRKKHGAEYRRQWRNWPSSDRCCGMTPPGVGVMRSRLHIAQQSHLWCKLPCLSGTPQPDPRQTKGHQGPCAYLRDSSHISGPHQPNMAIVENRQLYMLSGRSVVLPTRKSIGSCHELR